MAFARHKCISAHDTNVYFTKNNSKNSKWNIEESRPSFPSSRYTHFTMNVLPRMAHRVVPRMRPLNYQARRTYFESYAKSLSSPLLNRDQRPICLWHRFAIHRDKDAIISIWTAHWLRHMARSVSALHIIRVDLHQSTSPRRPRGI